MIVVVPAAPPRAGPLDSLTERTPLSTADARRLYEAALRDVCRAVLDSGGELLVNHRDGETLPEAGEDPEGELRELLEGVGSLDDVRFERQVGSTRAARVGNTVTHLLEREDARSVGVLEPTASLVTRSDVDGAAMSTRRNDLVLGATGEGGVFLACFVEPIEFDGAYRPPALATLAERAAAAGRRVGLAPRVPTVASPAGLRATVAEIGAREAAGLPIPEATASVVTDVGLSVGPDGELAI